MSKIITLAVLTLMATGAFAGPLGLAVNWNNELVLIDFINGPLHVYGIVSVAPSATLESVAVHPDGRVFAGDNLGNLYLINLTNPAQSTLLGNLGLQYGSIEGLDFDGTDLFAVDSQNIYWVDTGTLGVQFRGNDSLGNITSVAIENSASAYTVHSVTYTDHEIHNVDPNAGLPIFVFQYQLPHQMRALDLASDGKFYGLAWVGKHYEMDMVLQTATLIHDDGGADWSGVSAIDGTAVGACCLDGDPTQCLPLPQGLCEQIGGAYVGDNTSCAGVECETVEVDKASWGTVKSLYR